jgi:hypothetical protein
MLVDNLFESACRESMPSSVDYIIDTSHNVQVPLIIKQSCIASGVVPWGVSEIFLDKGFVVAPKGQHERGRHREFDHNPTKVIRLSDDLIVIIYDLDIVSWHRSSHTSWQSW